MNATAKIILGIIAGLAVLCLCAVVSSVLVFRASSTAMVRDLTGLGSEGARAAGGIADYTVPDGFNRSFATEIGGFSLVAYTGDDDHSHIYLFQLPPSVELDQAEIERQLREAAGRQDGGLVELEEVDRQQAVLRGQEMSLVVSEGLNHDGQTYRQVSGVFQGRGGQALVLFSAPTATWDQAVVDEFLASIR